MTPDTAADQAATDVSSNVAAATADNERARARGAETTMANEMGAHGGAIAALNERLLKAEQRLDALEQPIGERERMRKPNPLGAGTLPLNKTPEDEGLGGKSADGDYAPSGGFACVRCRMVTSTANVWQAYVAALREELRQKTESHRLAATEAEKLRADLAETIASRDEMTGRAESAEARVRDLEAKIEAVRTWIIEKVDCIPTHALIALSAALGKEQPNG